MIAGINYLKNGTAEILGTIRDNLSPANIKANITAAKVAKVMLTTFAIFTASNVPGADAGPITAWVSFAGCVAATIWVPWFMVECPEVALIAAALPTP